jgi:hypothetical protein
MMIVLKKEGMIKSFQEALEYLLKIKSEKGIDAHKYCGTVKFGKDGLGLQRKWRDEWQ